MTHTARIKIAAAVVMFFFAAISTAGVLSHTPTPGAGHVASALHAAPALAAPGPQTFEHESND